MTDIPNVPVPDQLAALRQRIAHLEAQERELREAIIANPDIRTGNNWIAEVKTVTTTRTDIKEMRANHPDLVSEFTFPTESLRVVLSAIDAETGEITRRPRTETAS